MFGVKNYNPKFYIKSSHIIQDYKKRLESLKGKKIEEIWIVWNQNENEWFSDLPVIIKFEDAN